MKKWMVLCAAGVLVTGFLCGGCGRGSGQAAVSSPAAQSSSEEGYPVTVENYDSRGEKVSTVYTHPPRRIIALWQNSVETLIELGAADTIIAASGIDDENHLTPENRAVYKTIPVVSHQVLNQEMAVSLQPDFILGWLFDFTGKANSVGTWNYWHERQVPVYMTMMNNADFLQKHVVEEELKYIEDVGAIVGKNGKAKEIVDSIKSQLDTYAAYGVQQDKKQKVLIIGSAAKELHVYTPRTLPGDIVTRLGGQVLGEEVESIGNSEIMSYEAMVDENPDVVFIQSQNETDTTGTETLYGNTALQDVSAIRNHRVYAVPFYTIRCPAVRIRDSIDIFAHGLYPDMK